MSIRTRLLFTFLTLTLIPVILTGALSFYKVKGALKQATLNNLQGIAVAKKTAVMEYLSGKKGRTVDFASDGFIRDQAELILKSKTSSERLKASNILNLHLKANKKSLDEEIVEVRVLDTGGRIIATSEGEFMLGIDSGKNQPYFQQGLEKTYIQDAGIFMHYDLEQEVISIATPLKERSSSRIIGVMVNFYSLANIRDVLLGLKAHQWGEHTAIDEEKTSRHIFLTNQDGLLLTPSRKLARYRPLTHKINTPPIIEAVQSSRAINTSWTDISGRAVLGASALLEIEKDWKWILVVEQDASEVLASIYALRDFSLMAGGLAFLLAALAALFIAHSISAPVIRIARAADKISKGDSYCRLEINSRDEIGHLAASFNRMVERRLDAEEKLKLANAMIGEEKTKYEMVLASIGDGMIVVNREGEIMLLNRAAERMFGWKAAEITSRSFSEIAPCEDEKGNLIPFNERTMYLALANNATTHSSAYYLRRDNTKFPVAVTASPIAVQGKTIGAIGIFRDITKEKEVDRMKTEFISTVSHEIRTPLTTIREGVSQAVDGILGEATPKQKEVLSIVLEDTDRLKRIIDNLLDISKIESGMVDLRREFVDMVSLIQATVNSFCLRAKEKGLSLKACLPDKKIKAFIDKDRITQVLTNLIGNSLKFTSRGNIEICALEKEAEIECSVTDTGCGIAEDDLPRVFSKFQQFGRTAGPGEKGTGLGLSITKGIVELHKGRIWIDSQPDKGTRITFTLPRYRGEKLFRECIAYSLKKSGGEKAALSILAFDLKGLVTLDGRISPQESSATIEELEMLVKSKIRWETDMVVESQRVILMLLSGLKKDGALIIQGRIRDSFDNYLAKKGWKDVFKIGYQALAYPEDGKTAEELTAKIPAASDSLSPGGED